MEGSRSKISRILGLVVGLKELYLWIKDSYVGLEAPIRVLKNALFSHFVI